MNINNKLEEIRRKPEHIRLRYVWAMVAVSMALILAIWFISFKSSREEALPAVDNLNTSVITDQFNQGKESLKNASEGFQSAFEQAQSAQNNSTNNTAPEGASNTDQPAGQ